jgi:hypothetical protein
MANRTVYSRRVDVSIVSRSALALPFVAVSRMAARASNRKAFADIVLFPPLCIVAEVNRIIENIGDGGRVAVIIVDERV